MGKIYNRFYELYKTKTLLSVVRLSSGDGAIVETKSGRLVAKNREENGDVAKDASKPEGYLLRHIGHELGYKQCGDDGSMKSIEIYCRTCGNDELVAEATDDE